MTSRDTLGARGIAAARGDAEGVRAAVTNGDMLAGAAATAKSDDMLAGAARFDHGHFEGLPMAGF
jgi:hypothetical protein